MHSVAQDKRERLSPSSPPPPIPPSPSSPPEAIEEGGSGNPRPLILDSFCGGGGASTGIERALGRPVDFAVNHDAQAIGMHAANHAATIHAVNDIWAVDPAQLVGTRRVDLAWFSPDCKHFSKAKGGRPREQGIRDLAWVVVRWARLVRPRVILLENVEEFQTWGPLLADGSPCPARKGITFRRWVASLERQGYRVEWRELRACDYGAPTIRKRLFLVARCDGQPIVWPEPTHGPGTLQPYRTAAEIIDWSQPCPSLFDTSEEIMAKYGVRARRPLADATLARIREGLRRFVLEHPDPFVVPVDGGLIAPTLIQTGYGERPGQRPRYLDLHEPLGTVPAGGCKHALVTAFLAQHNGGMVGHDLRKPMSTISSRGSQQQLVSAFLAPYYGSGSGETGRDMREPVPTITTKARLQLITVTIQGAEYVITDIGMRMLTPRELYRAQGFPEDYVIDRDHEGRAIPKTAQIRMAGNSVPPPVAEALVRANLGQEAQQAIAA